MSAAGASADPRSTLAPMAAMSLASWLFIRNAESIWVERPHGLTLILAGPQARRREQRDFISEAALEAFQRTLAEGLAEKGWFLHGVNRERRTAADRRSAPRATPDRRGAREAAPPQGG